ncbi:MAG: sugar phosphate isomerase/epimerase family protein [Pseudomonadota bacterium]
MSCSFEEDVKLYSSVGCQGIGVWGFKMEQLGPERAWDLMQKHGLRAANCIPELNSIMPYVLSPEPADPRQRVDAFLSKMERMAKLQPESIVVITGPQGDRSTEEVRDLCLEGFERIGRTASDLGVTIALEPIHLSMRDDFTEIWDVPGTLEILEQLNQPSFKILFDTWHLWDTPEIYKHLAEYIDLIGGVHVSDWRKDSRSWADRAFPGEGILPMQKILDSLDTAGFDGFYDVEIFSDNGHFDTAYHDSLWELPPEEIVDRATRIFRDHNAEQQ